MSIVGNEYTEKILKNHMWARSVNKPLTNGVNIYDGHRYMK